MLAICLFEFNLFSHSKYVVSLGMISSDTYNFANLLINQFVIKAGDNDLNFEGVRTIGQIFDVKMF